MFDQISNWLFHRALRLSTKSVTALAKKTKQDPARIAAVNDAVANIVTHEAVQAALDSVHIDPVVLGKQNAGN